MAVPQLVVLAVNVVEASPGSVTALVGLTVDPGTPLVEKVTVAPVTGLPLASTMWNVMVQLPPGDTVEQAAVLVIVEPGGVYALPIIVSASRVPTARTIDAPARNVRFHRVIAKRLPTVAPFPGR